MNDEMKNATMMDGVNGVNGVDGTSRAADDLSGGPSSPGPEDTAAEAWKAAKIVGTEAEASLVAGFLNSNGIEAQVESLQASEFPTDLGHLGEVHVMVPAERLDEAQRLLAQIEAETATPAAESAGE